MKGRILSTLGLWLGVLAALYWGGEVAGVALVALLSGLAQYEFYKIQGNLGLKPMKTLGLTLGTLLLAAAYLLPHVDPAFVGAGGIPVLVLSLLVLGTIALRRFPQAGPSQTIAPTFLGILLLPFPLQYLVAIVLLPGAPAAGMLPAIWVVAVVKFNDVGALLTGLACGRHPFAPEISPKKTWEGVVGGTLVAVLVGLGLRLGLNGRWPESFTAVEAGGLALLLALGGTLSDLLESTFKREAGVKDSGHTVPGIGGLFDLADSFILSAPLAYYALILLWR